MKMHMVSVYWRGRRYTLFVRMPVSDKPVITNDVMNAIYDKLGVARGDTIGIGV